MDYSKLNIFQPQDCVVSVFVVGIVCFLVNEAE